MSEQKPGIAVDLDDVLFDFAGEFFAWHNQTHGTTLVPADAVHKTLWAVWGGTKEEAVERILRFWGELDMLSVAPMDGAVAALRRLQQAFRLHIVSARDPVSQAATRAWLDEYFPGIFDQIVLGMGNPLGGPKIMSKGEACRALGAVLLVDDQLGHAMSAVEAGVPALLFGDLPWNRAEQLPATMRRVTGWPHAVSVLLEERWLPAGGG